METTVMNVVEEVPILVYDMDTVVFIVRCQDFTMAVCGDADWIK